MAIAQVPIEPRHDARLLDVRNGSDHRFFELPDLLHPGDLVVVNRTRVRHARLLGRKIGTGGEVELLLLRRLDIGRWEAMVRPARRLRAGTTITLGELTATLITDPVGGLVELHLTSDGDGAEDGNVEDAIQRIGQLPLPPYISDVLDDPGRYQTMFAAEVGSAAAPTAGLHFTADVVDRLGQAGVRVAAVELDVGLDTFRPISAVRIEDHIMHRERCGIDESTAQAIRQCREGGGRVVAVGTTVVRTLETFACLDGTVESGVTETSLFLRPGSSIRVVDLLVTNFHLPRSSLLVLVETFMGPGWRDAYRTALQRGYRFLSFGDAMLCPRVGPS